MIVRSNSSNAAICGVTKLIGTLAAGTLAIVLVTKPAGALNSGGKLAVQALPSPASQAHYTGKKHRHPPRKRIRRSTAKYGRHLYPYPYYPPCPYYFPAYGTYPCFAQGYYPNPPYSYGFGFGGPFWGGGIFDDD